ncbi:hypothetical protein L6R44_21690 [Enterobacter cloacae complex sp. ECC445]|uniref:hypothetical protein n=1 Tax=Enterobacter cloacae complex sp. ECC445 TaxID=2913213 RepID=UPI001F2999C3|nr:hypothetical protein [Enterobacter cloacae complex sp. ECC445]MCG0458678.1 hypothetical protein [Enterobacter cloacae complex sp. ECC445]
MFDRLGIRTQSSIEKVTVKNVLNPMLWICGLISLPSLLIIFYAEREISWVFSFAAIAPITAAIMFYAYFAIRSPDRLQSEGYQLKKQALELIEEKGSLGPVDVRSLEVISNPEIISLDARPAISNEEKVIDKESV